VHPNDRRRVVRALELTDADASLAPDEDRLWATRTRRPTLVAGLDVPRHELERRIEERTDEMFRRGVVDEVQAALRSPISATAEKTLGLKEIAELSPADARDAIVRRTLRYAAYQRKWMRRIPAIVMIDAGRSPHEVADAILEVVQSQSR
jgi:tRNA dimethylallyltransferase